MVNRTKNKEIPSIANEITNWLIDKKKSNGNKCVNFMLSKLDWKSFKANWYWLVERSKVIQKNNEIKKQQILEIKLIRRTKSCWILNRLPTRRKLIVIQRINIIKNSNIFEPSRNWTYIFTFMRSIFYQLNYRFKLLKINKRSSTGKT